ncbi:uncharacterized protein PODANS_3_10530 [Podospora anserina S mat+]|uniref:Podospora anserina S mat+ genomic DNA chromosome 3, supercontig 3 n=1 Tax=Podospora anserina (strain S / ATCC MYA-4624 / DSM 980 / FGSC 10383) TaxID=515849 RepID=B2AD36_PODAN|nr:uncharacterized protein PODANS_3_10530 [Podospora anserina S mat+]CAP61351.1 unnamed protein product [Podospora anserina S mat+]CDP27706.1 Putative protein of unknown function [Podospora anserina S mat+]
MQLLSTLALLGSTLTALANPLPSPGLVGELNNDHDITPNGTVLVSRDIRGSIPIGAHAMEHRFQPVIDFDKDGCYYTSAVDRSSNLNPGLGTGGCPHHNCRELNRLENNNVYSRMRCNNGWCAIMYEYYFEKDLWACGSGHRHEWENIIVFVQNDRPRRVSGARHGTHDRATNSFRVKDDTRVKMVYHKEGAGTHNFRTANAGDDKIENHTGQWFLGRLVGWNHWPSVAMRNKVLDGKNWSKDGGIRPKLGDRDFADNLRQAAGNSVPGFNPSVDG